MPTPYYSPRNLEPFRATFVIVSVWSIVWACIQMGLFGWQMKYVTEQRSISINRNRPSSEGNGILRVNDGRVNTYMDNWKFYYSTPEQRFYTSLLIMQILVLLVSCLLLLTTGCFLYAVKKFSRNFAWPWMGNMLIMATVSGAWSVMWWVWAPDAKGARLGLTISEFIFAIINLAILIVTVCIYNSYIKYAHRQCIEKM